jgi:hypothetical protein
MIKKVYSSFKNLSTFKKLLILTPIITYTTCKHKHKKKVFISNKIFCSKKTIEEEHKKIEEKLLSKIKTSYSLDKVKVGENLYINTFKTLNNEDNNKPVVGI